MPYPDYFYYELTQSGKHHQVGVTGCPDIQRCLNGHSDFWECASPPATLAKKTIILGPDWSIFRWSDKKKSAFKREVKALIEAGFEVYLWQQDHLKLLTKDLIKDIEEIFDINNWHLMMNLPESPETIAHLASLHKISAQQMLVLDHCRINQLLNHDESPCHPILRLQYLAAFFSEHVETIIRWTQALHTEPIQWLPDIYSWQANTERQRLRSAFPELIELPPDYHALIFSEFESQKAHLLNFEGIPLLESATETIENLTIKTASSLKHSMEDLQKILVLTANHLQSLNSEGFDFCHGELNLPSDSLRAFESLVLNDSSISPILLANFIEATHELKEISLPSAHFSKTPLRLSEKKLHHLTSLDLQCSDIDDTLLSDFLKATSTLQILNLHYCQRVSWNLDWSKIDSSHLIKLTLTAMCIPSDILTTWLTSATSLEELDLNFSPSTRALNINPGVLTSLVRLDLSGNNTIVDFLDLKNLLEASPNLKALNLNLTGFSGEPLLLEKNSLSQLETLNLALSKQLTLKDLIQFLKAAPNLTKLDLNGVRMRLSLPVEPFPILSELQELFLVSSGWGFEEINFLIKAAPNLTYLNLAELTLTSNCFPNPLPHLQQLTLNESRLSGDALVDALKSTPRLTTLNLWRFTLTNDAILSLEPGSLPYLTQMTFSPGGLSDENIKRFLAAAPSLNPELIWKMSYPDDDEVRRPSGQPLDADTTLNPDLKYEMTRVFYPFQRDISPPDPRLYRQDVFQTVTLNPNKCAIHQAFFLKKRADLSHLVSCDIPKFPEESIPTASEGTLYLGIQSLKPTKNWQPLCSLSPHESILRYHTKPEDAAVEISYSTLENLYYVRMLNAQKVDIDFTLYVPTHRPPVPDELRRLADEFRTFGEGALDGDKDIHYSGQEYLNQIMAKRVGACRHRALALKATHPELTTRIINNVCHSYVEVFDDDIWFPLDLGGYAANLTIHEPHKPLPPSESTVARPPRLKYAACHPKDREYFEEAFQTWERPTPPLTQLEYCQQCLNGLVKKRLIECKGTEITDALHLALEKHALRTRRPVFYINGPDDCRCSAPFIKRQGDSNLGVLTKGPGGPLYDFLSNPLNQHGLLIVNFSHFKPEDLVTFNALLDDLRKVDGTEVPKEMTLIGLQNIITNTSLPGSDFYSRFDKVESSPITEYLLEEPINTTIAPDSVHIDLFHAFDWEARLLGRWMPNGDAWRFEEGALQKAMSTGSKTITIQHGLWENQEFVRFWREAQLRKTITHAGQTISIEGITLIRQDDPYPWDQLSLHFRRDRACTPSHEVLNPATLVPFFHRCSVDAEGRLFYQQSFIQIASHKTPPILPVYITKTLSDSEWAMLLTACKQQTPPVTLSVAVAPGVLLPQALHDPAWPEPLPCPLEPWDRDVDILPKATIIQSSDVDTTVAQLSKKLPLAIIIDVSECHASDLIERLSADLHNEKDKPIRLQFKQKICALSKALEEGRPVILKGRFTPSLANELAPFLHQRSLSCPLMLVGKDVSNFSYMPIHSHQVSDLEKSNALQDDLGVADAEVIESIKDPLNVLETRWRLKDLPPYSEGRSNDPGELIVSDAERLEVVNVFTEGRRLAVSQIFDRGEPYVYLTGFSGGGKTTFVTKELPSATHSLHMGESKILAWARDRTRGKRKILFIDEANLKASDWTMFEGLYSKPPGILCNGEYLELTDEHKVIFAGNPLHYKGERRAAAFFKRPENEVEFRPLPSNVIYETMLKPIFQNTILEADGPQLSQYILKVYRTLCGWSDKDVLISPRELQMIALLTISYVSQAPLDGHSAEDVVRYFAYHLTQSLVPLKHRGAYQREFKSTFIPMTVDAGLSDDFLMTQSRTHTIFLLNRLLNLREIRHEGINNPEQRYGGLGGIIYEGEPGCGKSELVTYLLTVRNYKEGDIHSIELYTPPTEEENSDDKPATPGEKMFYRLPPSFSPAKKELLLRKAFDEGAIVVIDEINSSPMMEALLNDLLMGRTPEGKRPKNTGFMVVGTQNPITMAGRRAPSTAQSRRMITEIIPPYPVKDMQSILISIGVPEAYVPDLVSSFQQQVRYANKHHKKPEPTFRHLMKFSKALVRGLKAEALAKKEGSDESEKSKNTKDLKSRLKRYMAEEVEEKPHHPLGSGAK